MRLIQSFFPSVFICVYIIYYICIYYILYMYILYVTYTTVSVFIYVYIICYIYYCFCTCYEMVTIKAKRNIIREEEKFSEEVRKFCVLYSKQHSDHKDKHVLNNAWRSADQALGLEEGNFYFILRPLVVSFLLCFFVSFLLCFLLVCLFVYSFVPSFVLSFVGSFIQSIVPSFFRSLVPSCVCFLVCL